MTKSAPFLVACLLAVAPPAGGEPGVVGAGRAAELLARTPPLIRELWGVALPEGLAVSESDLAGHSAVLERRYARLLALCRPDKPEDAREFLARGMARACARYARVAFDPASGRLSVLPGPIPGLTVEGDEAVKVLVAREVARATLEESLTRWWQGAGATAGEEEARRAFAMVRYGWIHHNGDQLARVLGASARAREEIDDGLPAIEAVPARAGRRFVEMLQRRSDLMSERPSGTTHEVFHPELLGIPPSPGPREILERGGFAEPRPASELLLRLGILEVRPEVDLDARLSALDGLAEARADGEGRVLVLEFRTAEAAAGGGELLRLLPPAGAGRATVRVRGRHAARAETPAEGDPEALLAKLFAASGDSK